ncbi:hypothetical protein PHJA_000982300 [Phtheirospermum japonicum]|uniref:Uncharacterized protein n=1 Tax=Phtheirospermum japonicum TaxID=374723 RepID=A0A830BNE8_9LAMI|nr:hypothetical protein PHJA_000982300 [Phtheirospermum japonicum]
MHNLDPCASYSSGVRSLKYSHPCPLTSIPRASYPFSLNHGGGSNQNRKTCAWITIQLFPQPAN